jgi:hypothetical protein
MRRFAEALSAARAARVRTPADARWAMLEAQSLQGLGQLAEAADAYDAIARAARGSDAAEPAFRAATVRLRDLHDPRGAVRSLDGADVAGSPLEERVLGLRARALEAAGERLAAADAARAYLDRYPHGGLEDAMRRLADF